MWLLSVLEKKLNDMNNMMNAKEEKLRNRHRDTFAALQWFRDHKQMFKGNVHEPMMLVVSCVKTKFNPSYKETYTVV